MGLVLTVLEFETVDEEAFPIMIVREADRTIPVPGTPQPAGDDEEDDETLVLSTVGRAVGVIAKGGFCGRCGGDTKTRVVVVVYCASIRFSLMPDTRFTTSNSSSKLICFFLIRMMEQRLLDGMSSSFRARFRDD